MTSCVLLQEVEKARDCQLKSTSKGFNPASSEGLEGAEDSAYLQQRELRIVYTCSCLSWSKPALFNKMQACPIGHCSTNVGKLNLTCVSDTPARVRKYISNKCSVLMHKYAPSVTGKGSFKNTSFAWSKYRLHV